MHGQGLIAATSMSLTGTRDSPEGGFKRGFGARRQYEVSVAKLRAGAAVGGLEFPNFFAIPPRGRDYAGLARLRRLPPRSGLDRLAVGTSVSRRRILSRDKPQIELERHGPGKLDSRKVRVRRIQNVVPFADNYGRNGQNC